MKQPLTLLCIAALMSQTASMAITTEAADRTFAIDGVIPGIVSEARFIQDLDGDDQLDVITAQGNLYALSSASSEVIWQSEASGFIDVAIIRDRNGDGISDLISASAIGMVVTSGADGSELMRITSSTSLQELTEISDLTGDGTPELSARIPLVTTGQPASRIQIIEGDTLGTLGVIGDSSRDRFAQSFDAVGDLNGDGVEDLLIAAGVPTADNSAIADVRIHSGAGLGFISAFTISDSGGITHSAERVADLGDINADGLSDILVAGDTRLGENEDTRTVVVDAYSERSGALIWRTLLGGDLGLQFRTNMATADIDGDGIADVAIAVENESARFDATGKPTAELVVLSGLDGRVLQRFQTDQPNLTLGRQADLADVNNDGLVDVLATRDTFDGSDDALANLFLTTPSRDQITARQLSGGWVDRFGSFPNQGVFLEFTESTVDGSPLATLIWYGYQGNDQRFLIGGPIPVPDATSLLTFDLISATGAQFGDDFVSSDVSRLNRGQAVLHIGQCDQVDLHVSLDDGEQSTLSLEPFLASTFGLPCQAIQARSLQSPNKTGIWWNQSRDGEGYFIDTVNTGNGVYTFAAWFAYNQGNALWVAGGGFADEQNDQAILDAITAQRDGAAVELIPFGTLTLDYDSCGSGNLSYQATAESVVGEQTGSIAITDDFTGPLIGVDCQD